VYSGLWIVDIAIKERAMVGIEHDLVNGRSVTLWNDHIDHAFTFRHQDDLKTHRVYPSCSGNPPQN
jgi:hypothetical protein